MNLNSKQSFLKVCLIYLAIAFFVRLPTLFNGFYNDEIFYSTVAQRMLEGINYYEGIVDHKPPLINYIYMIFVWIAGWKAVYLAHYVATLILVATSLCIYKISNCIYKSFPISLLAGIIYLVAMSSGNPTDIGDANAELLFNLPLSLCFLCFIIYRQISGKSRWIYLAIAGISAGISVLIKQHPVFILMSLPVFILFFSKETISTKLKEIFWILFWSIVPVGILALELYSNGTLDDAIYWMTKFTVDYLGNHKKGFDLIFFFIKRFSQHVLLGQLGLWSAFALWMIFRSKTIKILDGFGELVFLWFVFGFLAVFPGYRFYGHYFLHYLPPLCVLTSAMIYDVYLNLKIRRKFVIAMSILFFLPFLYGWVGMWPMYLFSPNNHVKAYPELVSYLSENTRPNEKVEVWSKVSFIPFYVEREGCTRFIDKRFVTGHYSSKEALLKSKTNEKDQQDHLQMFLFDLEKCKPMWIVDMSPNIDVMQSMESIPPLKKFLNQNYKIVDTVKGSLIYKKIN